VGVLLNSVVYTVSIPSQTMLTEISEYQVITVAYRVSHPALMLLSAEPNEQSDVKSTQKIQAL